MKEGGCKSRVGWWGWVGWKAPAARGCEVCVCVCVYSARAE